MITDAGLKEGVDLTISCNPIIKLLYMQVKKLDYLFGHVIERVYLWNVLEYNRINT